MIYAIDYGTSNSLLAAAADGRVLEPIPLDPGADDPRILRSVQFCHDKTWQVGSEAIHGYGKNGAEGRFLRSLKKYLPSPVFTGTRIDGAFYTLGDLISIFLKEIRRRANEHFGKDIDSVVLGRPARFSLDDGADKLAQSRLEGAAKIAGFKHIDFCPEPIAAAHEFRTHLTEDKTVLIADFGGGTSDFTVLRLGPRPFCDADVLSLGGVSVAGDAFDGAIMRHKIAPHFGSEIQYKLPMGNNILKLPFHLVEKLCSPADISFLTKRDVMQFLKEAQSWSLSAKDHQTMEQLFTLLDEHLGYAVFREIEVTKRGLSSDDSVAFTFHAPAIHIDETVVIDDFDTFSADKVERITESLDETIRAAGVTPDEIDIVCCTGGTARVKSITRELAARFSAPKLEQYKHFYSVVQGLAERAKDKSRGA